MRRAGRLSEAGVKGLILLLCYCTGQGKLFSGNGGENFILRCILKMIRDNFPPDHL
jgi:hypothetical protein